MEKRTIKEELGKFFFRDDSLSLFVRLSSMAAGAYHGFCNAQGMPLNKGLEHALTYGPAGISGMVYMVVSGVSGAISGGKEVYRDYFKPKDNPVIKMGKITGGIILGSGLNATGGAAAGTVRGGLDTLIGYCMGYAFGNLSK